MGYEKEQQITKTLVSTGSTLSLFRKPCSVFCCLVYRNFLDLFLFSADVLVVLITTISCWSSHSNKVGFNQEYGHFFSLNSVVLVGERQMSLFSSRSPPPQGFFQTVNYLEFGVQIVCSSSQS